jgi:hypothetical protein
MTDIGTGLISTAIGLEITYRYEEQEKDQG